MVASLKQLVTASQDYNNQVSYWRDLHAMSLGGGAVTMDLKKRLLVNVDGTKVDRAKLAPYDSLMGSVIVKLVSQLMHTKIVPSGSDDGYWKSFFQKCGLVPDIDGFVSYEGFLAQSALFGLTQGRAIAQIDTIAHFADNISDQRSTGADNPYLILRNRWDLVDYEFDRSGFRFAKLHSLKMVRNSWNEAPVKCHKYTIYQIQSGRVIASCYSVYVKPDAPDMPIEMLGDEHVMIMVDKTASGIELENVEIFHTNSGRFEFPIVMLTFPRQLWLADQLYDTSKSFFNQNTSLEWSLMQTNYALPVFTGIEEPHTGTNPAAQSRTGDGRFWELKPGQDVHWLEKEGFANKLTMEYLDALKRRMMDIVQTIAASAKTHDNSGYSNQSGESKREDRRDMDILLDWYGEQIKRFGEQILNVASIAHGEDVNWTIDGFSDYHSMELSESIADYTSLMKDGGLDSAKLRRELQLQLVKKAGGVFKLSPDAMSLIESELAIDPYNLDDSQRDSLIRLTTAGYLAPRTMLEIFKKSGDLPSDFDIESAIEALEGEDPEQESIEDDGEPSGDLDGKDSSSGPIGDKLKNKVRGEYDNF
jgi:hypothetical protein